MSTYILIIFLTGAGAINVDTYPSQTACMEASEEVKLNSRVHTLTAGYQLSNTHFITTCVRSPKGGKYGSR